MDRSRMSWNQPSVGGPSASGGAREARHGKHYHHGKASSKGPLHQQGHAAAKKRIRLSRCDYCFYCDVYVRGSVTYALSASSQAAGSGWERHLETLQHWRNVDAYQQHVLGPVVRSAANVGFASFPSSSHDPPFGPAGTGASSSNTIPSNIEGEAAPQPQDRPLLRWPATVASQRDVQEWRAAQDAVRQSAMTNRAVRWFDSSEAAEAYIRDGTDTTLAAAAETMANIPHSSSITSSAMPGVAVGGVVVGVGGMKVSVGVRR